MQFICLFILSSFFTYSLANVGAGNPDIVEVLIWSGGSWAGFMHGDIVPVPNYLGHEVDKRPWKCPVDCRYTSDKSRISKVDAVMFEAQPITSYYDEYKRDPPQWPMKYPHQYWINTGYETEHYFHLYGDPGYIPYIDINMTFNRQYSQVPISFTCLWGGDFEKEDFLKPHPPKEKDKCVVFMSTNCASGGAKGRTAYAKELMDNMHVDSLGQCLHNKDMPKDMQFPIYSNHGASMKNKIEVFKRYKFVLTFENNNVTDYVTEKMCNVLQAGSVPVYMGSDTVHPYWTPGEHSIVRVSDFKGPADMAKYLQKMCDDDEEYEKFFEWKKKGLSKHFEERLSQCAFYGAECRLCQHILERRKKLASNQLEELERRHEADREYMLISLNHESASKKQYLQVAGNEDLYVTKEFTLTAWVKFKEAPAPIMAFSSKTITLSVVPVWKRSYLELCVAGECYLGSQPLVAEEWYHIGVGFFYGSGPDNFVRFYVNGKEDPTSYLPERHPDESDFYSSKPTLYIGTDAEKKLYFRGFLEDISFWRRTFDAAEMKQMVWRMYGGSEKGLIAYWSFDARDGQETTQDEKGKHHAKLMNDPDFHESKTRF